MTTLDRDTIDALAEELGPQTLVDVLRTFLEDAASLSDAIRASGATGDLGALGRAAHTLKSTAALVGASELAASCAALELAAREGGPEDLAEVVTRHARTASDAIADEIALRSRA